MNKKRTLVYTIVAIFTAVVVIYGIAHYYKTNLPGAMTLFLTSPKDKVLSVENIVPRDITKEISAMKGWEETIELPKDTEMAVRIKKTLETAREFWNKCQELVNSKQVKTWYWNGMYNGNWKSKDKKEAISFTFKSDKGEIRACSRSFYIDDPFTFKTLIREKGWRLQLYDDLTGIEGCFLNGGAEIVYFYPGNKISFYGRKVDPAKEGWETWYEIEWDENGKILREQAGTYEIPKLQRLPTSEGTAEKPFKIE